MERLKIIVKRIKDQKPKEYILPQDRATFTIGSSKECDVVIARPGIEDRHLQITRNKEGATLVPLTLRGEVAFNSSILKRPVRLSHRDSITIADTKITVFDLDLEETAPDEKTPFAAPLKPQQAFKPEKEKKKKRLSLRYYILWILIALGAALCLDYINPFMPKEFNPFAPTEADGPLMPVVPTQVKTAPQPQKKPVQQTKPQQDIDSITLKTTVNTPYSNKNTKKTLLPVAHANVSSATAQELVPKALPAVPATKTQNAVAASVPEQNSEHQKSAAQQKPLTLPTVQTAQNAKNQIAEKNPNTAINTHQQLPAQNGQVSAQNTAPEPKTSDNSKTTQHTPAKTQRPAVAPLRQEHKPAAVTYAGSAQLDAVKMTYNRGQISTAQAELKKLSRKHPHDTDIKRLRTHIGKTAVIWNNLQRLTKAPQQYVLAQQLTAHEKNPDNYYLKQARIIISQLVKAPIPLSEECYQQGLKSRAKNKHEQAYEYFKATYLLNPSNTRAKLEADRMRKIVQIKRKSLRKAGSAVNDKARSKRILKRVPGNQ